MKYLILGIHPKGYRMYSHLNNTSRMEGTLISIRRCHLVDSGPADTLLFGLGQVRLDHETNFYHSRYAINSAAGAT